MPCQTSLTGTGRNASDVWLALWRPARIRKWRKSEVVLFLICFCQPLFNSYSMSVMMYMLNCNLCSQTVHQISWSRGIFANTQLQLKLYKKCLAFCSYKGALYIKKNKTYFCDIKYSPPPTHPPTHTPKRKKSVLLVIKIYWYVQRVSSLWTPEQYWAYIIQLVWRDRLFPSSFASFDVDGS